MNTNKFKLSVLLLTGVLVMAGCSNQSSSKNDTSSKKATTASVKTKSDSKASKTNSSKENEKEALWNNDKDNKMKNFIDQWAPTMKQSYVKYDGTHSLKTSTGTIYPDDFSKVSVEGTNNSIGFSKDGNGNNEYNVVAIYNYNGTVPPLPNHITYFFAFHNGKPVALVDQSRDGTPNLTETENTKVKSSFARIAAGKNVTVDTNNNQSESKNSSEVATKDPKMIAPMIYELAGADLSVPIGTYEFYTANGKYWIGTGTVLSRVGFTINGDTITYYTPKYNFETKRDDWLPHDINLSELESKYYSTNDQKELIQSVAGKLPGLDGEN